MKTQIDMDSIKVLTFQMSFNFIQKTRTSASFLFFYFFGLWTMRKQNIIS